MSIESQNVLMYNIVSMSDFSIGKAKFSAMSGRHSAYSFYATATHGKGGDYLKDQRPILFEVGLNSIVGTSNDIAQSILVNERHEKVIFD